VIKKIISGEPITAKILYKQPIEYVPFARLLIATNEQPYLKTIDDSIRRRFIYLHLKNSFLGKEDFDLLDKLSEEKELIFAWAIT
jgi:putative DNA primase/helicase